VRRLQNLEPLLDAKIKYVPPLILDNLAVDLGPWSGYHLLAQHPVFFRYWGKLISCFGEGKSSGSWEAKKPVKKEHREKERKGRRDQPATKRISSDTIVVA